MGTWVVFVVLCAREAEQELLAGRVACPCCAGVLRPHGWARHRTVRWPGPARVGVTPRRARCSSCSRTQVLLPAELCVRRADTAEVIGMALVEKALGSGWRTIASRTARPASTVRRWLRAARREHADWLNQRAAGRAARLGVDVVDPWRAPRGALAAALVVLLRTAEAYRRRLGWSDPLWSVANALAGGRLLAPRRT